MCVAIFKPAGRKIPEEHLKNAWQGNSDGAGFAYVKDGKVVIQKGYMALKDFLTALEEAEKANKKSPFVVHLRTRTQGAKDAANTQPFAIEGGCLAHNGGFQGTGAGHYDGASDSRLFAERYTKDLTFDFVEKHKAKLEELIGYNKVILLYDDGRRHILLEKDGTWENDIWYSNMYFKRSFGGGGPYDQREYERLMG
jgi:predicted glutamine amidotransferase